MKFKTHWLTALLLLGLIGLTTAGCKGNDPTNDAAPPPAANAVPAPKPATEKHRPGPAQVMGTAAGAPVGGK